MDIRFIKRFCNFIILLSLIVIAGCATSAELRKLSVGMDKKSVADILGEPITTRATTRATGLIEVWDYTFAKSVIGFPPFRDKYYLFFKDSKLVQWGEENDWGSSPDHTEKIILQKSEKQEPRFQ